VASSDLKITGKARGEKLKVRRKLCSALRPKTQKKRREGLIKGYPKEGKTRFPLLSCVRTEEETRWPR